MLVSDAISIIRARINDEYDTGYSDFVLMDYINDAIKFLAGALIVRNDPVLTKDMDIYAKDGSTDVPKNFVRFAGGYPVKRKGQKLYISDSSSYVRAKYFFVPDNVSSVEDEMPFPTSDIYEALLIHMACIYALNQHEFNVERDQRLRQELEQIMSEALGAVE